jgi:type II secretory pathway component PulJ
MKKARPSNERSGFAVITVLIISLALFGLLSLALSTCYWLHSVNRHALADLQTRAEALHVDLTPP